jgi:hypothetical protein
LPWLISGRRKRSFQTGQFRAEQFESTLTRPTWVGIGRFRLYGIPELSSIGLIIEGEVYLWAPGIPHHCRCVVAAELLLPHKSTEKILHFLQLVAGGRSFSLSNNTHDEMRLRLSVQELGPRHSGHRLLAKKKARP